MADEGDEVRLQGMMIPKQMAPDNRFERELNSA
jgi:hypothetical protein